MRDKSPEEFRIIFAIGANDSREIREHPDQEISLEEYKKNILQLIQLAKALSKEVVIVGLFPADEKLSTPYKEDKFYFNQKLEKYNNALREIAADEGLQFVDIFASLLSQDYLQLLADGLHPNTAGHQFIFEAVKKALF
jgi:lysophospholipase L1-like esterase